MKVIDLLKILLTQVGDIPKYIYFEDYKYEYDSKENDYFCEQLNFFLFMNVLGESLELNLDLPITIIEEDKEIEELKCLEIKKISEMYCLSSKNISEEEKWEKTRKLIYEYRIDLENLKYCINELIENINELKKGK